MIFTGIWASLTLVISGGVILATSYSVASILLVTGIITLLVMAVAWLGDAKAIGDVLSDVVDDLLS